MATPMCQNEDGNQATFIGTFLESGTPVRVCDDCMVAFTAAVFQQMTGVDMSVALQAASGELDQEDEQVPTTAEGAPSDEPPAAAPADPDHESEDGTETTPPPDSPETGAPGESPPPVGSETTTTSV